MRPVGRELLRRLKIVSRAFVNEDNNQPEDLVLPPASGPYYVLASALEGLDNNLRERAVVVEPVAGVVGFLSRVTVRDERGKHLTYALVNEEEADPPNGTIGMGSPLARALLDARAGDRVTWVRPVGDAILTVEKIDRAR